MRLAKPKRKGLLSLLFSRVFIIVLLILVQVAVFVGIYLFLAKYVPYFVVFEVLFTIAMLFYVFNSGMDTSAKLTWLLIIAVAPIPGSLFLAYTKINVGHREITRRITNLIDGSRNLLTPDAETLKAISADRSGTASLDRYIRRTNSFPVWRNSSVQYFPLGEDKFKAMLLELEKAEKFIFMEYFIIEEGEMWGDILDILARKAKEGVDVRVMYDGLCEITTLPGNYDKLLGKVGIKARPFSPLTPMVSTHYNYRDHRKILVIDGKVAFNGGVNLADEYINRIVRFGHWKDTALMIKGPAVQSFTLMFLQMWNVYEKVADFSQAKIQADPVEAEGYVMPYGDCPLDTYKVGESVYTDILYRANRYVHIMTPYLILDGELETALKYAAERGIDVRIILPGIPDKKTAYSLAKAHYRTLIESGVKIYEYTPGFIHAKVVIADDEKAVVGTINFDYRSLYHHFECATYMYRTSCIPEIEKDFLDTQEKCSEVTPETIKKEKLFYKVFGTILKLFAPLF